MINKHQFPKKKGGIMKLLNKIRDIQVSVKCIFPLLDYCCKKTGFTGIAVNKYFQKKLLVVQ